MRNRQCIIILVLFVFLTAPSVWAQHHPGKAGIGLTVSGSEPGFILSFKASPYVMLEPTFSTQFQHKDLGNQGYCSPGMGILYQLRQQNDFRPYVGVRFGLDISRPAFSVIAYDELFHLYPYVATVRKTYVDVFVGPVFGTKYYLSDHFALSGEFQVKATFYDRGARGENYRGVGDLSVSTSQLLAAYLYF